MNTTGTTNVTITLDTNHDRDGSLQTCNSHSSAFCGASTSPNPLDMFSYTLALRAVGGTVAWGNYVVADPNYFASSPVVNSDTEIEINMIRPSGTVTRAGLTTLGTIPVTPLSGTPRIDVQIGPSNINPFGFGTGFGTTCDGSAFANTYVLGNPSDPCGTTNGIAGDWFDWDGVQSAVGNPPTVSAPLTASGTEGVPISTITATATDPDAARTLTITQSGMPADLTFTADAPGPSPRNATISGAPGDFDAGTHHIVWTVTDDNGGFNNTSTTLTIANSNRQPTISFPDMRVAPGGTTDRAISGTDPDGESVTFTKLTGPTFVTVTTLNPGAGTATGNIHAAPGPTDTGLFQLTIRATDASGLTTQLSHNVNVCTSCPAPFLDPVSSMTVAEGAVADQTITGRVPDGAPLTFVKLGGPSFVSVTTTNPGTGIATGNLHVVPGFADAGAYPVTVAVTDGASTSQRTITITATNTAQPPTLNPIADMTLPAGTTQDQTISATDSDGNPLTFSKTAGPVFMTVSTTSPGTGTATGMIHLAPGLGEAGANSGTVRVSNGPLSSSESFSITVTSGNQCPVANPGGPYSGLSGVPIAFNGSASSDPDGNPLTYSWDFDASNGIQVDATGAMVSHPYAAAGSVTVTLTVTDNGNGSPSAICSASSTTTASITAACAATVFNGYDSIKLNSGKPTWFAYVQPTSGCYANSDASLSSFVMKYATSQISASGKTSVGGDKNSDGIPEIKVTFSKSDLRTLFAGLPNGHNNVTVTIEANLVTGGILRGTTQLDVTNNGNFTAATVSPNPLNPGAILTFTTNRQGFMRIDLFNIQGRLVRRLVDESALAAGIHDVTIDGRGGRGEKLPSGVYYIRGTSAEGEFKQLITILK